MRRRPEPDTIDATVVAKTLEDEGYHDMARFVRQLGDGVRRANVEAMTLRKQEKELLSRLRRYETSVFDEPVSCKPGPMSDG